MLHCLRCQAEARALALKLETAKTGHQAELAHVLNQMQVCTHRRAVVALIQLALGASCNLTWGWHG